MKKLEMGRDAAKKGPFFRCDAFVSEATAKNLKSKNAPPRQARRSTGEKLARRHLLVIFD